MGLNVNQEPNAAPPLSRLYLGAATPAAVREVFASLQDIITTKDDGAKYINDENDTFCIEEQSVWSTSDLKNSLSETTTENNHSDHGKPMDAEDGLVDYNTITKRIAVCTESLPPIKETPYFNHEAYFENLKRYQDSDLSIKAEFGRLLLYGEVITSTNTILEK